MRLDVYLSENGICKSRSRAQELIRSGAVSVSGKTVNKPSLIVEEGADIVCDLSSECKYVSRGGLKLEEALKHFGVDPEGMVCIDIGSSTGGFTDCLLQHGARLVYSVDSGKNQLVDSLKSDPRVKSLEKVNARYLKSDDFDTSFDIAVMDVSFISQTKLYPAVTEILKNNGTFISLIKPQFEVGQKNIGKGGIVRDKTAQQDAIKNIIMLASGYGLSCVGYTASPIQGGDGNTEFLACFRYNSSPKGGK